MNIKLSGASIHLKSSIKKEELALLNKMNPEALALYKDVEKTLPVFSVSFNPKGASISDYGIVFDSVAADGCLEVAVLMDPSIPASVRRDAVTDKLMVACDRLMELELKVSLAAESANIAREEFAAMVEEA